MNDAFVLDRALILNRLGGDEEIFSLLVALFLQDVDNNVVALTNALASGVAETLRREAHTINGLLATFSDDAAACVIEQQAKLGDLSALQSAIAALQRRLLEVAAVLRQETGRVG